MRNLADTLARLKASPAATPSRSSRLDPAPIPAPNPGGLKGWRHVPAALADRPGLVVVLHGCTQTAVAYDHGSGWSTLADRDGFVVLYPEQQRANNANLCFNWFSPEDTRRGGGEAASIQAMIQATVRDCGIDPERIFVTGLSAGGAMTSVMLATYPELFAGGAIIAGLPYAAAASMPEAFDRMRGHGLAPGPAATSAVLTASGHTGPWPTVSIFQGSADHTVAAVNAEACVAQWLGVHDLSGAPDGSLAIGPHRHDRWRDREGRVRVEHYRLTGMGHGVPLAPSAPGGCGAVGPYMLDVGLSSSEVLAATWGLAEKSVGAAPRPPARRPTPEVTRLETTPVGPASNTVQTTIERALRQAGLMR